MGSEVHDSVLRKVGRKRWGMKTFVPTLKLISDNTTMESL